MAERFLREVGSEKFNPEQYVHELSLKNSDGASELLAVRQTVQSLADDISGQLKRNVFNNYTQFIETAKEISYLESEMYQLSHMLTEQKTLMTTMLETSVLKTKPSTNINGKVEEKPIEEPKKTLTSLLEKVEGCASIMDVSGRYLVYNGDLIEVDPNTFNHIGQVHAFLLNDGIVFAAWMHNRGPVKYKFQIMYMLDSLPVVNVRDLPEVKNAFKIMLFPESRLFICDSPKTKKEWLEHIEVTKRMTRNSENARCEPQLEVVSAKAKEESEEKTNPFLEDDDENEEADEDDSETQQQQTVSTKSNDVPDWLADLPEDLDVCIAQRDFEEATNLIEKAEQYIKEHSSSQHAKETKARIESRTKILTEELQNELRVSADKSIHGGPRAARRAVFLLVKLGKCSEACSLFLRHHSAIIKHSIKQLKLEGETKLYIKRLCAVFFTHIMDTCHNLEQAFSNLSVCASAFIVWACNELQHTFVATFVRQVFTRQVSLSLVADCVTTARQHCDQLAEHGLDLTFKLNSFLQQDTTRLFTETKDKMLEAIKLRAAEDKWRQLNYQSKAGLEKFLDDLSEMGIQNIQSFIHDECRVELTSNTIQFTKAYLNFLGDALKLHTDEIHAMIDTGIYEIMRAQLRHIEIASKSEKLKTDVGFVLKNGTFLLNHVLTLAESYYEQKLGYQCVLFVKLRESSTWLTGSITKYSSSAIL